MLIATYRLLLFLTESSRKAYDFNSHANRAISILHCRPLREIDVLEPTAVDSLMAKRIGWRHAWRSTSPTPSGFQWRGVQLARLCLSRSHSYILMFLLECFATARQLLGNPSTAAFLPFFFFLFIRFSFLLFSFLLEMTFHRSLQSRFLNTDEDDSVTALEPLWLSTLPHPSLCGVFHWSATRSLHRNWSASASGTHHKLPPLNNTS